MRKLLVGVAVFLIAGCPVLNAWVEKENIVVQAAGVFKKFDGKNSNEYIAALKKILHSPDEAAKKALYEKIREGNEYYTAIEMVSWLEENEVMQLNRAFAVSGGEPWDSLRFSVENYPVKFIRALALAGYIDGDYNITTQGISGLIGFSGKYGKKEIEKEMKYAQNLKALIDGTVLLPDNAFADANVKNLLLAGLDECIYFDSCVMSTRNRQNSHDG